MNNLWRWRVVAVALGAIAVAGWYSAWWQAREWSRELVDAS